VARHIIDTLPQILPAEQCWKLSLLQNWATIVGPLKDKVHLHKVGDDHVILTVAHPSLAQELLYLSELLREKINAAIGTQRIKALHFRAEATKKRSRVVPIKPKKVQPVFKKQVRFSPLEKKALTSVENKELRDALSQFYITCKRRKTS
jgi:hypothetical protein